MGVRERKRAGVRQTRATLLDARRAVDSYIAANDGGCPPNLASAAKFGPTQAAPRDAWGRPLRLTCPGRWEGSPYELISDGPDGKQALIPKDLTLRGTLRNSSAPRSVASSVLTSASASTTMR